MCDLKLNVQQYFFGQNMSYYYDYINKKMYLRNLKKRVEICCTEEQYGSFVSFYSILFHDQPFTYNISWTRDEKIFFNCLVNLGAIFINKKGVEPYSSLLFNITREYSKNPLETYQSLYQNKIFVHSNESEKDLLEIINSLRNFGFQMSHNNHKRAIYIKIITEDDEKALENLDADIIVYRTNTMVCAFTRDAFASNENNRLKAFKSITKLSMKSNQDLIFVRRILIKVLPLFVCYSQISNISSKFLMFDVNNFPQYISDLSNLDLKL